MQFKLHSLFIQEDKMQNLTELTSKKFLEELSSSAPTPGGGGAAALAGAMAAALASMVGNLTIGKEKFVANEAEVKELLQQAEEVRFNLLKLVEEDATVFGSFMSCYKLPKSTVEEKAIRAQAICEAAKKAAEVPLNIARETFKILSIAQRLAIIGNPNVITDAVCSALLARAALRCSEYNVLINLNLTKDVDYNNLVKEELKEIKAKALNLEELTIDSTNKAIK